MATSSFDKEFQITKNETKERLERDINRIKPLTVNTNNVIDELKRSDDRLLDILRSKD